MQAINELDTSGQFYHHLRELLASGLIRSLRRNHYSIRPENVVPCLVIVAAAAELASQFGQAEEENEEADNG